MIRVIDGHNDLLSRLMAEPHRRAEIWLGGAPDEGHLDLPRMRAAGLAGGFFAIWHPSPETAETAALRAGMADPPYALPLPDPLPMAPAQAEALQALGHLMWMERASGGGFRLCRSLADLRAAMDAGAVGGIAHLEGAEAIGPDLDALHVLHAAGLRSLGPVWSRPTVFGHGVPFRFPAGPDTGPGLTEAGRRLVAECQALRILVDVSHLNEQGFWDVARMGGAPLVATHSNAHAVCASTRNLTDRQLDAIRDSDGMVGLNFGVAFLRPDGRKRADCGWDPVLRQLDHLIARLGEGRVGLGSDFDGTLVPDVLGDVTGLPRLFEVLAAHGYDAALIDRLAHGNWLAALGRVWGC
ncbi:MAG: dipeptidase [Rhodobacterales bacterium]|nr:dipeptidase [Rhodobacterales bacterium]